jgi:hypothetical protein
MTIFVVVFALMSIAFVLGWLLAGLIVYYTDESRKP